MKIQCLMLSIFYITASEGMLTQGPNLGQFFCKRSYGFLAHSFNPPKNSSDKEKSPPKSEVPISEIDKKWHRRAVWL